MKIREIAKGKMVKERMTKGKMGKKARQGMALFLAGLMVVSAVDLSGLRVNAAEMTGVSVFAEAGWEDSQQSVQSTEQDSENQNDSKPGTQNGEQNSTQEASQSSAQNGGQDSENQNVSQFSTQQESKLSTQSEEQNSTQEASQPSVQSTEQGSGEQGSLYFEIQPEIQSGNEIAVENYTAEEAPELTVKAAYSNDSGDSSNGGDSSNSSAGTEISYQWYVKKTVDGTTTEAEKLTEQGADSATYQIPTGLSVGVYEYYCVAACGADTVTSQTVTFTVAEGVVEAVVNGQTKRYATLEKARDAIVAEINDGEADAAFDITLKVLKNISETGCSWTISGADKKVSFRMDVNGCAVSSNYFGVTGEGTEAVFTDSSDEKSGSLNAALSASNQAKLTLEGGRYYKNLNLYSGAVAELKDCYYSRSLYLGKSSNNNTGISCTITGGTYEGTEIEVYGGAELKVSGDAKIKALKLDPRDESGLAPAKVTLSGGEYGEISISAAVTDENLQEEEGGFAFLDMLSEGYAFYAAGVQMDISRTDRNLSSVKVLSADTSDDSTGAVVKFVIEKNNGERKERYFHTWDAAVNYVANTSAHQSNGKEYGAWEKLEVVLLQDTTVGQSINEILDKEDMPAEITLRSEGDAAHTLSVTDDISHYLFITGEQDVTIENIALDGRLKFQGGTLDSDTNTITAAVLRLGENVTIGSVMVDGRADIVIQEGARISEFNGDDDDALDARIYCNQLAADFTDTITGKKDGFQIWYPITLPEGLTMPDTEEGGANADCVRELDGSWYGLPGKDITVAGEICTGYQTADNTELERKDGKFTMPAAAVAFQKHETTDNWWQCEKCQLTDLSLAYAGNCLRVEGLENRTFDTWPQYLTRVVLIAKDGTDEKELVKPKYARRYDNGDKGINNWEQAEYCMAYQNPTNSYLYKPGEEGFDAEKAPKVTITGINQYTGTVEIYYTIGQGEFAKIAAGTIYGGETEQYYDATSHGAWSAKEMLLWLKPDETDIAQGHTYLLENCFKDGSILQWNSSYGTRVGAFSGTKLNATVFYSKDNMASWIVYNPLDYQHLESTGYYIKNAGSYPFYLKVVDYEGNCGEYVQTHTAVIQKKNLEDEDVTVNMKEYTAYYNGREQTPDIATFQYNEETLTKDKDYTITYENNTNPGTATAIYNGAENNYTGTRTGTFEIKYAFTAKQTEGSLGRWYNSRRVRQTYFPTKEADAAIFYRAATEGKAGVGTSEKGYFFYDSLEAALDNVSENSTIFFELEEGINRKSVYIRDWVTGYIGAPVELILQADWTAPYWTAADGSIGDYGIQVKTNWFQTLLNKISFGLLYNDAQLEVRFRANDTKEGIETSGVDKYCYYIDRITDASEEVAAKTISELSALQDAGKFTEVAADSNGAAAVSVSDSGKFVVYAYAVDKAGNQSDYISSNGVVLDNEAPEVSVSTPDKADGTLKDTQATLKLHINEKATLLYFWVKESSFDTSDAYEACVSEIDTYLNNMQEGNPFAVKTENGTWVAAITESGEEVAVAGEAGVRRPLYMTEVEAGDSQISVGDLQPLEACTLWAAAIDKAGNLSAALAKQSFTTTRTMPTIEKLPAVGGVYGDTAAELKITENGKAVYDGAEVSGTWEVADTRDTLLPAGTTEACRVTFTPEDSTRFESVVEWVVPVIEKRSVTINVQDMHVTYSGEKPEITTADFAVASDDNRESPLAGDDSADTIADTLTLVMQEEQGFDAGTYDFTVVSDSRNYEVTPVYYASLTDTTNPKSVGTLTIAKAAGEIIKGEEFATYRNMDFRGAGISLAVTANHSESRLVYTVSDSKNVNRIDVADDQTVVVDEEGNVTATGAGFAVITISLLESQNYMAAEPVRVNIGVVQGYFQLPMNMERNYPCDRESSDTIDFGTFVPDDYGAIEMLLSDTYLTDMEDVNDFFSVLPSVQDGKLSYTIKPGKAGDSVELSVDVSSDNYSNSTTYITLKRIVQKPVKASGDVTLVSSTMTYGEALSSLRFNSTTFVDANTKEAVSGTLAWVDPDYKPEAGEQSVQWRFTPESEKYATLEGQLIITVEKATPQTVELPGVAGRSYHPEKALTDSELTGGKVTDAAGKLLAGTWSWQSVGIVPVVDNTGYTAVFTPEDDKNYEQIMGTISVEVTKAVPVIAEKPAAEEITYGESLGASGLTGGRVKYSDSEDIAVEGTFTWKDAAVKPVVADSDSREFVLIFTPADTVNYDRVETEMTVSVRKAAAAPNMPGKTMNVSYSTTKVGEITLPENWAWQEADRDTLLEVEKTVTATALYTGADKGNYETESVEVSITRSACEHKNTEIKNVVDATCEHTGYSGDIYCKDCGVKLTEGTATAALGHTYTGVVTKEPTTGSTGIRTYTCSRCNSSYEEVIPELPEEEHNHSYSAAITRQATCTEEGIRTYSCSCGDSYTEQFPAPGHSYTSRVTKSPTTREEGVMTYTCSRCGASYTRAIAKLEEISGTEQKPAQGAAADGSQNTEQKENVKNEPFVAEDSEKSGWQMISKQLEQTPAGDIVEIDMNGATTVPSTLFEQVKGKDVQIVFQMGDGICWTVDGRDVTDIRGDIDFGVTFGGDAGKNIPVDVINQVTGEQYSVNLTLAYSGEFGFSATLTVNLEEKNVGYYANLFYYNPDSGALEFICAGEIGEDGNADLTFTHASDYTIVISSTVMGTGEEAVNPAGNSGKTPAESAGQEEGAPASGDSTQNVDQNPLWEGWWISHVVLAIVCIGGGIFLLKRKKSKEQ